MSLTTEQKNLVRATFAMVAGNPDAVAALFYNRLFAMDPSLRALFTSDMTEQGEKLMQMIAVAVASLDRLDALVPAVEALGARHVKYGVTKAHYATVGAALLWTLEQGLGAAFTPEAREAWTAVYTLLAQVATAKAYDLDSEAA